MDSYLVTFYHGSPPDVTTLPTEAPSLARATEWGKSIAQERGWRVYEVAPACGQPHAQCLYRMCGTCEYDPKRAIHFAQPPEVCCG